ncbi:MAG: GH92 family glycosyl hydrolase [Polyangiaceae bacterium]
MRTVALAALSWMGCAWLVVACDGEPPVTNPPPTDEGCWVRPGADEGAPVSATAPFTRYVDPFIGTGGLGFGTGSAFPGPEMPFGMVRPGPDTMGESAGPTFSHCAGYSHEDEFIFGFSQTRMHGTGIVDYGTIGLMPTIGMSATKTSAIGHKARFSHESEHASPGRYDVVLEDGTKVELTATDHVGLHRYTFPSLANPSDATVLVDVGHALPSVTITDGHVQVLPDQRSMTGFARFAGGYSDRFGGMPVYFALRFDRPFVAHGVWKGGALADAEDARDGGDVGAWASFDTSTDREVGVAIGISFVDVAHAQANLDLEAPTFDFDGVAAGAEAAWEAMLSRVEITGRTARDLEIQYTALYHTLLMPTLAMDADGSYRGLDGDVHVATGYRYSTDFSLWDTYRTLHPWLSLVFPERQRDMLRSITAMSVESGAPPQWVLGIGETGGMVGDGAAIVVSDSYARGVRDFDVEAAYGVLRASATTKLPKGGRDHVEEYLANGFIPIEQGGASGSTTLEYAEDDYALSTLAAALGKPEDAAMFLERSRDWKNLWDARSGYLLGRHADGSFPEDDTTAWQDYWAEGSTEQYTWFVPHDVAGLAEVMGGRDAFLARLDGFFATSSCEDPTNHLLPKTHYWHSNEPVLAVAWMFAELDDAARAGRWARWALETQYGDGPDGLPGNDDGGAMSAWALFAGAGFYPRIATSEYVVGAPVLPSVTLHLPGGDFTVKRHGPSNGYASSATLDGVRLSRPRFDQSAIASGGVLDVELTDAPMAWR